MNDLDDELAQLLDKAVKRLSTYRRTFTAKVALAEVWEDGFDISLQADPQERFVLAYEADGKHPRQWRLDPEFRGQILPARVDPFDRQLQIALHRRAGIRKGAGHAFDHAEPDRVAAASVGMRRQRQRCDTQQRG